jgi:DNA adenine methylase
MRSIFRYPGGKTRGPIQRWILSHRPPDMKEYREPFVGGGGVFFALKPQWVRSRWINDLHPGLIAVYRALAECPNQFIALCRAVPPALPGEEETFPGAPDGTPGVKDGKPVNARLKAKFDEVCLNEECDQAFRYFFVNRTVFGGRVNYDRPSRLYFSKPEGWDVVKGNALDMAARHVEGAHITCGDFEPLFAEPGDDVWIYADPPYDRDTKATGNSKLYQHSFTEADHRRLADAVKASPHRVCLSYADDADGLVRSLYPEADFTIVERRWAYCGSTNATKDRGRELLILNYEPPQKVFSFPDELQVDSSPLSDAETAELARREAVIERNLGSFVETGEAFRHIRDHALYRDKYKAFRDYCRERWGLGKSHVYRLIDAAALLSALKTSPAGDVLPKTERQVRELCRLRTEENEVDVERAAEVWARVVEASGEDPKAITAKAVRAQVQEMMPPQPESGTPPEPASPLRFVVRGPEDAEKAIALLAARYPDVMARYAPTPVEV